MRCTKLVVGLGFSAGIPALRTGTSGTPTTTKFAVTWHTDNRDWVVKCVAMEDVRQRWNGETHSVGQGEILSSFGVDDVPHDSWEIELEDQGRRVPQFECQMLNAMKQVECTATSAWVNAAFRQNDGTTTPCLVIENKTPIDSRKNFHIRAFTTWDSTEMRCIAAADIQLDGGQIMKQGEDLFPESEWKLTLTPDQTPDDYERATQIMLEDFNSKIHGFVCSVARNGQKLCKAESWNAESKTNIVAELGGCGIQITNEEDLLWPVYYPIDWGQRHFQITAASNSDAVSTLLCWPTVDVETKTVVTPT